MEENLEEFKRKMEGLAKLNEKYRIHGAYQNHAGANFGAPVWDLWQVLRELDPQWIGCQYDIRHAFAEGRRSWELGLRSLKDHINCLAIKDFVWMEQDGSEKEVNVPVGEGLVNFKSYFKLVDELGIRVPITLHIEYPLFPEEEQSLSERKKLSLITMQKDVNTLNGLLP